MDGDDRKAYRDPLALRYAGTEMSYLFSDEMKFRTWRRLWIALAEAEKEMGLPITDEQIQQLRDNADNINYEQAEEREHVVRHDVMSHVYAYGLQAPAAAPIIHLGATSCFVGDNTDLIIMDKALELLDGKLVALISALASFAERYKDLPTLAFTHFQAAQPTTVGKRATLWIQDLLMDRAQIASLRSNYMLRGLKGATGTQASFLALFDGDAEKVLELERRVVNKVGYLNVFPVAGQTYPRKFDSIVINALEGIAESAGKFGTDMRLLQHMKELEEPFEDKQIGSSAMAYKRNPMRCERICGLSRYVISLASSPAQTAATQWLERTLDDSSNRRLVIPQVFLAVDAMLNLYINVASGIAVHERVIAKRLKKELPFMATETILMEAVKRGADRQEAHEHLRQLSRQAASQMEEQGGENPLIYWIANDPVFRIQEQEIRDLLDPAGFTGLASEQVEAFLRHEVRPVLERQSEILTEEVGIQF
ncbi:MAG: adenylosuccinate lyase [Clostridia bacterium]|nr:adenylosuccinate lyase [Clostridia bacterium]